MSSSRTPAGRLVDTLLVGDRWRTFCGCSQTAFLEALTAALEEYDFAFDVDEQPPSGTERVLYGSDGDGTRVTITEPLETELTVVPVTADPIARAALSLATRADGRERATANVCLVDVSSIPDERKDELATLMQGVMDRLECEPWDLADHPRFKLAVLQRYKIRRKWRYWSRRDRSVA
ncbi:hypothetical protein [Natronolimnohabitans innermongolicus]|uniref:hypothetical protein n=1 Tax=Natronolimnohabitans innermongolicus TaxID=253107 RepID=UPI000677C4DF|nr:hypothetical protein [Natronolimnohabitans innermongolicus]